MKIVLAYSGGLDTSVALQWLQESYSAEVIAFCANIGQVESLDGLKEKAEKLGASKVYVEDLREEFISKYAFRALIANAAYEGKYLLAAPLSRYLISKRLVEIARAEGADAVAHGATGKGNDQVRFYASITALDPNLRIITPLIEWDMKSRDEEINYAQKHGIDLSISSEQPYSIDTNLWGTSIECGILDNLEIEPPEAVFQMTSSPSSAPEHSCEISIGFEEGIPVSVNNKLLSPTAIVSLLNSIGSEFGIGRIDIIENRLVGIKTRGVYESPAGTILHTAHKELESLVMERDLLHYKSQVSKKYSEVIYDGLWFSSLKNALDKFLDYTQINVTGIIYLKLYKGNITVLSRNSDSKMYKDSLSTYGENDEFNHEAGLGFAYVWSMPLRIKALTEQK